MVALGGRLFLMSEDRLRAKRVMYLRSRQGSHTVQMVPCAPPPLATAAVTVFAIYTKVTTQMTQLYSNLGRLCSDFHADLMSGGNICLCARPGSHTVQMLPCAPSSLATGVENPMGPFTRKLLYERRTGVVILVICVVTRARTPYRPDGCAPHFRFGTT